MVRLIRIRGIGHRALLVFIAVLMFNTGFLMMKKADFTVQAAQVQSRSILMSTSNPAATANSVTYQVRFTAASSYQLEGIVVDFCTNDPIVGDSTCTAPTGFDVGGASPTVITNHATDSTLSTTLGALTWTATGTNTISGSTKRTITLTNATGVAVTNASVVSFDMTNVTNPTTTGSFYARIITYTTPALANAYVPGTEGAYSDYGGIALSTGAVITITSKVEEQITFCVYTNASCGLGGSSVILGDTHGVLYTTGPFVDTTTKYNIGTNASHGVSVNVFGTAPYDGAQYVTGIGSTAAVSVPGTSQFGMCDWGTGLTIPATYEGLNGGTPQCNTSTQTAGTSSTGGTGTGGNTTYGWGTATAATYGDPIATTTGPINTTGQIAFIGNVSLTQQAGIYTTILSFIATGTY